MLDFEPDIWIVGLLVIIYLFEFHSLMEMVRFGHFMGGLMNHWFVGCEKLVQK